jgi:hypothetical protein
MKTFLPAMDQGRPVVRDTSTGWAVAYTDSADDALSLANRLNAFFRTAEREQEQEREQQNAGPAWGHITDGET